MEKITSRDGFDTEFAEIAYNEYITTIQKNQNNKDYFKEKQKIEYEIANRLKELENEYLQRINDAANQFDIPPEERKFIKFSDLNWRINPEH